MAEVRSQDIKQWLSTLPETTYGTPSTTNTDYSVMIGTQMEPFLPMMDFIVDPGRLGLGYQYPTKQCPDYWSNPGFPFADEMYFNGLPGRLLLRGLGGTPTITEPVASTAYQHLAYPLPASSGHQLPGTSIVSLLGGASFLTGGNVVEEFTMSQKGTAPVQFQTNLIGTGYFVTPHGIASMPTTIPTYSCPVGSASQFIWTENSTTTDWSSTGRVREWSVGYKNNLQVGEIMRRQGDSLIGPTNGQAYYANRLLRGTMTVTASVTLTLVHNAIAEWLLMAKNTVFTDVTFRARGAVISGSTRESAALILPNARLKGDAKIVNENDLALVTLNFEALYDSTTGGLIQGAVVNTTATNYK